MKKLIKKIARKINPLFVERRELSGGFLLDPNSYINKSGWRLTFAKKKIVSADGEPIPWMNHATVMILKKRLNSELALFEYGSGYSTAFFAALVDHVVSIEYDEVWYRELRFWD